MTQHDPSGPKLTVVIPAFNVAPYIDDCLDSVFSQEGCQDFEVVVVDDGSTDGTGDLVRRIAAEEPRLRLITSANGGVGSARNLAVQAARGEIILFLDADDKMLQGRLSHQGGFMLNHPEATVTFGDAIVQNDRHTALYAWKLPPLDIGAFREVERPLSRFLADGCYLNVSTSAIRRSDYLSIGLQSPDRRIAEDMDLWCRIAVAGGRFFVTQHLYAWYRREGHGNLMSSAFAYEAPTRFLAVQLRLHARSLSWEERARAQKQLDLRANMYLRRLWAFDRHQLNNASADLVDVVSPHIIRRWRIARIVPAFVGRGLRRLKFSIIRKTKTSP